MSHAKSHRRCLPHWTTPDLYTTSEDKIGIDNTQIVDSIFGPQGVTSAADDDITFNTTAEPADRDFYQHDNSTDEMDEQQLRESQQRAKTDCQLATATRRETLPSGGVGPIQGPGTLPGGPRQLLYVLHPQLSRFLVPIDVLYSRDKDSRRCHYNKFNKALIPTSSRTVQSSDGARHILGSKNGGKKPNQVKRKRCAKTTSIKRPCLY